MSLPAFEMKEKFEKFEELVNHEPEVSDLQRLLFGSPKHPRGLTAGGKTVETAVY